MIVSDSNIIMQSQTILNSLILNKSTHCDWSIMLVATHTHTHTRTHQCLSPLLLVVLSLLYGYIVVYYNINLYNIKLTGPVHSMRVPCTRGVEDVRPLVRVKELSFELRPEVSVGPVRRVVRLHVLHHVHPRVGSFPQVPQPGVHGGHRVQAPVEKDAELGLVVPLGNGTLVQRLPSRFVTFLASTPFYFRRRMHYYNKQQNGCTDNRTRPHLVNWTVTVWSNDVFCQR